MMQDVVSATEKTVRDIVSEIHTALPGKIQSYNESTGMVNVLPYGTFHCQDGRRIPYPVISDVPVVTTGVCNASVVIPIKPEMDCLLVISEQSLDAWLYGTETPSNLSYDLTNAIAIPGLAKVPVPAQIEANQSDSVMIVNGAARISVSPSGITISGNVNIDGDIVCSGTSPWKKKGEE